ncbi:MAG: hypothetical protein LBN71_04720, partial [Tannerella sp.]|nr:hypothetical protein [Tannerella sp.]
MKRNNKNIFLLIGLSVCILNACIEDPKYSTDIRNVEKPSLGVLTLVGNTATSISLKSSVEEANGSLVTERGFCYGLAPSVNVTSRTLQAGDGIGDFSGTIEGLLADTTYYVCAYAKNEKGYSYGEEKAVPTNKGLGTVRTLEPFVIHATTAKGGGNIELPGEGTITERGLYIDTVATMATKSVVLSTMTTDSFVCNLIGLKPSTRYYVQAFVTNSFGAFRNTDVKTFETTHGRPEVDSVTLTIGYTDVVLVSRLKAEGDEPILTVNGYGFCLSNNSEPTIEDADTVIYVSATSTGEFSGTIGNLISQQWYYVRPFATNRLG